MLIAAIDPITATFVLAILVLGVGLILALAALNSTNEKTAPQAFAAVGVLFGLLAAGGLGGIFANQAAQSVTKATQEVIRPTEELTQVLESTPEAEKAKAEAKEKEEAEAKEKEESAEGE